MKKAWGWGLWLRARNGACHVTYYAHRHEQINHIVFYVGRIILFMFLEYTLYCMLPTVCNLPRVQPATHTHTHTHTQDGQLEGLLAKESTGRKGVYNGKGS